MVVMEEFWTAKKASTFLRIPQSTIYKLAQNKVLPGFKVRSIGGFAVAQVDLNLRQVEAAVFSFQSPFSHGTILTDQVDLRKTIEAGLLISQNWAERKRHLLIIVPANLRKQSIQSSYYKES